MITDIEQKVDVEIVYALLSGKVTLAINRTLGKKLKEANIDITPGQVSILYTLWHKDGITQKEIAEQTAKDKPSVTRLLDIMESDGLIKRKAGKSDRRTNRIYLTQKANDMRSLVCGATESALQEGCKGLTEKDMLNVQRIMKAIFFNLGGAEESEDDD